MKPCGKHGPEHLLLTCEDCFPSSDSVVCYSPISHSELGKLYMRLDELNDLKENWDSYGAAAIDPKAIDVARRIIFDLFSNELTILGSVNGGVGLECGNVSIEITDNQVALDLCE